VANNKLRPSETQLGHLQRIFKSLAVDPTDTFAYCGTTSGDVLQVGTWASGATTVGAAG
jgi:hypothetical protein